jgi:2-C-methyl-D-erythritol 2,4-cyclodiphosphate synthase
MSRVKIGHGYDVHALDKGEGITLGGVWIACEFSLIAHSDGDVLIHALCDALLGALGRGDIGQHFADTDPLNKDRDSREFLRQLGTMMGNDAFQLGNADLSIVAQAPKIQPHTDAMKHLLASDLSTDISNINIKATTTEKLGFVGRHEGIAAHAVVLLEQIQ